MSPRIHFALENSRDPKEGERHCDLDWLHKYCANHIAFRMRLALIGMHMRDPTSIDNWKLFTPNYKNCTTRLPSAVPVTALTSAAVERNAAISTARKAKSVGTKSVSLTEFQAWFISVSTFPCKGLVAKSGLCLPLLYPVGVPFPLLSSSSK